MCRFFACKKKGEEFTQEEIDDISCSWVKSRETTLKLLARVLELKPHDTKETLSLNEARNYIIALSEPMGEAVYLINKFLLSLERQKLIREKKDLKSQKEALIAELEKEIKELNDEKDFIYECASHFGVFLKENALIPYNDSFADYLEMLIKEEESKEKKIRDDKKIEKMKMEQKTYEQKKRVVMGTLASNAGSNHEVIATDIHKRKDKLCSLKHNGKTLKIALGKVLN